jgi:NADH:ubiquinone oxidoreductase subunit H
VWFSGTGITGNSTTAGIFTKSGVTSANVNDYFLNTSTGYVYKCTVAGNASTAKWVYVGSIRGATGLQGIQGP